MIHTTQKTMNKSTIPKEFVKFYNLLMQGAPERFSPWIFVLEQRGKDPLSSRPWAAEKSKLSFDEAVRFMEYGYNLGISARDNDALCLIDVDDMNAIPETDIKPTLSVMTRSRAGMHYYYYTTDPDCICNLPTDVGEVRSCNQYLVCPGSYVRTDPSTVPDDQKEFCGYYTLYNNTLPVYITFQEFPKVFRDHRDKINHAPNPQKREPSGHKSKSALFDLTIDDVISYPRNKYRFPSPFHDTKSGANASVSGGLIHCWRHLVSANPLQALSVLAGMYTCQQAGVSHANGGSGASMLDLQDGETLYNLWWYARRNGYIPANDPPPNAALRYFVVETGICKEEEIEDGWRIPTHAYAEGRRLLRANL